MPLRTWRIKIKNGHLAHELFQKWFFDYKYAYNKSNWLMTETTSIHSSYDLRNIIVPKEVNSHIPWFLETPKDIRAEGVFENYKNYKSAFTNLKNKHINHFKMGYMKKRRTTRCFGIPGSAIRVKEGDRKKIKIYTDYTNGFWFALSKPLPRSVVNDNNSVKKEHKIYFNGEHYYLLLAIDVEYRDVNKRKRATGVDPGVRKFMTTWDINGVSYEFGKLKHVQIKDLLRKRDYYQSCRDKKNYTKIEIRIKNLVRELHHQTSTFLCKRYRNIILPELDVRSLVRKTKNKEYRKSLLRMGIRHFNELLKTKAEIYKCRVLSDVDGVTESYSSRLCSQCKHVNKKCSEEWKKCKNCGNQIDRDVNGAKNIYLMNIHLV